VTLLARRVRLDLAYDGTDFAGWQMQRAQRTVQGVIEQALTEIQGGERVKVRGAGRTDAGVHARHQVADFEITSRLDDAALERALSRMLPADLRPRGLATTAPTFHAQNHAVSKTYRYRLDLSRHGDPLQARYALHYPHPLDLRRLEAALPQLVGRRDWSGFAASACDKLDRVRTIAEACLERITEHTWELVFRADGFLQHMVRNIVGTLLEIGGGRMAEDVIREVLDSGDRRQAGPTAPARGLCLDRVHYDDDGGDPRP
jgi:tRNA pseudouridine38-40 synthase